MGTAAVQIARALGAIVVGTAGTKDGMDVVTRFNLIYILCQPSSLAVYLSGCLLNWDPHKSVGLVNSDTFWIKIIFCHQVWSTPRVQSQPQVL